MEQFYRDSPIVIGEVAFLFGFSQNYLGQLFTLRAGKNLAEYVTVAKVSAARDMMVKRDMKIYEISEAMGFEILARSLRRWRGTPREITCSECSHRHRSNTRSRPS